MLMLLKEKSKIGYRPKDRKRFRPYMPEDHVPDMRSSLIGNLEPPKPAA
jgi:hypothetical protein